MNSNKKIILISSLALVVGGYIGYRIYDNYRTKKVFKQSINQISNEFPDLNNQN